MPAGGVMTAQRLHTVGPARHTPFMTMPPVVLPATAAWICIPVHPKAFTLV